MTLHGGEETDPLATGITWTPDDLTMGERAQLMVVQQAGRLEFNWMIPSTAAAIELVLLGKIGPVADRSFFNGVTPWKIVGLDVSPTGNPVHDAALQPFIGRNKPLRSDRYLAKIGYAVAAAVKDELVRRGMVTSVGDFDHRGGYLAIEDERAVAIAKHPAYRARSMPEIVTEPRWGGIVDALRNSGERYKGELGLQSRIRWEWYPAEHRDAIEALLAGENLNTATQ
ncbi:GPP34 family phosphoprotein [Cryobacterium sp. 1639]|uniref:GPP34 family phosphoprotein n=1 Tax=Cryobacterium inferilacus TaxID=2866629 RepID=UPI001C738700|nr:GPP34 family phosphoprotein [Cryobacterium sp. 1639]MBX0300160.1 GPP34 family phosphoprotein [Cryobacterium sp. 1639]